jgi:hypothetical protein
MNDPREKFVSDEEHYFSWYIDELTANGYIQEAVYQPASFVLSEPVVLVLRQVKNNKPKRIEKTLLNEHVYTADWRITWTDKAYGLFFKRLDRFADKDDASYFMASKSDDIDIVTYVDIKGAFSGPNNSSAVTFPLNQKWVCEKYGIYVQKVIPLYYTKIKSGKRMPHGLFADTFTPDRYLMQNERIAFRRTIHYEPRTLSEYIKLRQL